MGESESRRARASNPRAADFRSENFRRDRRRKFFRTVVKHAYPTQTAYELRRLTAGRDGKPRYGERTIYDWIEGKSDAPLPVFIQVVNDIYSE